MKVTSAILTTMSGKLGGAVASKARGGIQYFRKLVIPSNPRTTGQTTIRAILSQLAGSWRTVLTDVQRAGWTAISPDSSSGIDTYVAANAGPMQGIAATEYPIEDAPASRALATPYQIVTPPVIDNSANTLTVSCPAAAGRLCLYEIYITRPQNSSRLARQFPYQHQTSIASDSDGPVVYALPANFQGNTGQHQFVKVVAYGHESGGDPTATVGIPQEFDVTIVA